ncbi:MAG: undecaprenyl-diphosphate phosphatase [Gammaproteobacteria bacterium]|nr:undecaprenyl-diphosphate phosphatase [Gammaproteobacteria bacterium]MDH5593309.1 undecaprenyl-diphosphate phosphatase [Gammaproteobacteria bacterium]MDH5613762.1 undecaprenyl-diphosphate phosphatase [Gammaproteobacteria bacterium]
MELLEIIILGLIQGLTEFLPISSSAHLILVPVVTGWPDQGLAFDVAVHIGTLMAVVFYFRKDIRQISKEWACSLVTRKSTPMSRLGWGVLFGTIPVGLAGLFVNNFVGDELRSPHVIAIASIAFGLLLWVTDKLAVHKYETHQMGWKDVLFIGCAQALALIPGTSRSGITITAGLFMGLTRQAAARFSFLLSIPVIVLAGGLKMKELIEVGNGVQWDAIILGTLISGVSAWLCIHYFLKLLDKIGMGPFVLYRIVLGVVLLIVFGAD